MLRRPPRFPLVLSALVAAAGVAVLLIDTGSSPKTPPTLGLGPARACTRAPAQAEVTATSAIVITTTAQAPVSVTERATGPRGTASVTKQTLATARQRISVPVAVRHVARDRAGACADAGSSTAARDLALRKASDLALAAAHAAAARDAQTALRTLMRHLYPSVLRRARAEATLRAHQLAQRAIPLLSAQATAAARQEAGG